MEYLGIVVSVPNGPLHVWVHLEPPFGEITHVHVGDTASMHKASGTLNRNNCNQQFPGLWGAIETRVASEVEMDNGI